MLLRQSPSRRTPSSRFRCITRAGIASLALLLSCRVGPAEGQELREVRDLIFATVDGLDLGLDLYLPAGVANPPLVVWVHGGAWQSGTKSPAPMEFVRNGFATASIDFRQSTQARFPAQVHDIKAAIRFLRARASEFGYRTDQIAIAGSSSGGHLVTLVGVTNGHVELEGSVGEDLGQSSSVQAILNYYGATNLTSILSQSTPFGLGVREPALELLLGGLPDANEETQRLARLASPVFHVDAGDPPIHILHGDQDPQMPINQSHEIHGAYLNLGLDTTLDVVHGSTHGETIFMSGEYLDRALAFLRRTIGG